MVALLPRCSRSRKPKRNQQPPLQRLPVEASILSHRNRCHCRLKQLTKRKSLPKKSLTCLLELPNLVSKVTLQSTSIALCLCPRTCKQPRTGTPPSRDRVQANYRGCMHFHARCRFVKDGVAYDVMLNQTVRHPAPAPAPPNHSSGHSQQQQQARLAPAALHPSSSHQHTAGTTSSSSSKTTKILFCFTCSSAGAVLATRAAPRGRTSSSTAQRSKVPSLNCKPSFPCF